MSPWLLILALVVLSVWLTIASIGIVIALNIVEEYLRLYTISRTQAKQATPAARTPTPSAQDDAPPPRGCA